MASRGVLIGPQEKYVESYYLFLNASRSWMTLPMYGAPGMFQQPKPLDRTDLSVSVNICNRKSGDTIGVVLNNIKLSSISQGEKTLKIPTHLVFSRF